MGSARRRALVICTVSDRYAQTRYEALTGWKAPAAGGPSAQSLTPAQRIQDEWARQTISRELGHERPGMTTVYLGR